MPKEFALTPKQTRASAMLGSDARHILLFGGARSGKTLLIMRQIVGRALAHKSRHAVLRFRFNHVKASIIQQTLPEMMELCYPGVMSRCHLDKSDWFMRFPNGSEIWFGGLDEKERTEKILGTEYASIFFNECSQIPWASRNTAITRLSQKTPLRIKAYYDCNPPAEGHWTHRLFIAKRSPDNRTPIANKRDYAAFGPMNPADNAANLPQATLDELQLLPERMKRRFWLGQWGLASEGALWTVELIDQQRFDGSELPTMQRVVIAVDPSGCAGPEDTRSDEIGIVVCGLGVDGNGYVLEDLSGRYGPAEWGGLVGSAFDRHAADVVVAESNFGGAMVQEIVRAARPGTPFREVKASRGKVVRAEPVSALFEQQKVFMAGSFPQLEDQLCALTMAGYIGDKSPDRADAMVWGLAHLFPGMTRRQDEFHRTPQVILAYEAAKQRNNPIRKVITRRN